MKCKDYNEYSVLCLSCAFPADIKCSKEFDFETPLKYIEVQSRDSAKFSFNECPTCRKSIGYHPLDKDYRCSFCNQRISWE